MMTRFNGLILLWTVSAPIVDAFAPPRAVYRRPWTARSALALDGAVTGAATAIDGFFQTQPYLSAFLTCSFKAGTADFIAQASSEEDEAATTAEPSPVDIDVSRNLAFIVYGGFYSGLFQEFLYSVMFPQWFQETTWQNVVAQVGLDMAVIGPFLCLPVAYIVKSLFTTTGLSIESVQAALERYVEDVTKRGLLIKYWALWTPVQTLTFSVIPQHFRVAFVAVISFLWMFILSTTSANNAATTTSAKSVTTTTSQ